MIKEGQDAETLVHYCQLVSEEVAKILDVPWAYMVLKHTKGIKYPINGPDQLLERLKDIKIKGHDAAEILSKLQYPIKNPATLLHEIKQVLDSREEAAYSI